MRIGFVNYTPMIYDVQTPMKGPLGGSESAMCYLSVELAKRDHQVILFGRKKRSFRLSGVDHFPDIALIDGLGANLDFLIVQNTPFFGLNLRRFLGRQTRLVFWAEHASDQEAVSCLIDRSFVNVYDAIVYISNWQKEDYEKSFPLLIGKRSTILRNAISPAFENLFEDGILPYKKKKPLLMAYTSTPFRGLDILITIFPYIKQSFANVSLNVYSSLKVYQNTFGENLFSDLYDQCRRTDGVNYIGSLSQKKLAREMRSVSILTYPNTFPETSCISVMEAMAAGCLVVTSNLGALPETTAGFGHLVDIGINANMFCDLFIRKMREILEKFHNAREEFKIEIDLRRQVDFVNKNYVWSKRALEWEEFLKSLF